LAALEGRLGPAREEPHPASSGQSKETPSI